VRSFTALLLGLATTVAFQVPAHAQDISARGADIRIGGRLHSQYSASSVAAAESDFFFRRARLIADVTVTDLLDARMQTDFAGGKAAVQDAYLRFKFSPGFRVSMGQFKRAFDLFELSSSTDLSLIERDGRVEGVGGCEGVGGACSYSRLTEKLAYAGRDAGVRIDGSSGKVAWVASITNGTGINTSDENDTKSMSGRLTLAATDAVTLGANLASHDYVADGDNERGSAWGFDFEYGGWRSGFHFQAAVAGGDNWKSLDANGTPASFMTFQGVASYYVPIEGGNWAGVEPLLRVSQADPNSDMVDDGGLIFTPGLMMYVSGKNKIGVNLDVFTPESGDTEFSFKIQSFLYF